MWIHHMRPDSIVILRVGGQAATIRYLGQSRFGLAMIGIDTGEAVRIERGGPEISAAGACPACGRGMATEGEGDR
jgi:hypothetical protein